MAGGACCACRSHKTKSAGHGNKAINFDVTISRCKELRVCEVQHVEINNLNNSKEQGEDRQLRCQQQKAPAEGHLCRHRGRTAQVVC